MCRDTEHDRNLQVVFFYIMAVKYWFDLFFFSIQLVKYRIRGLKRTLPTPLVPWKTVCLKGETSTLEDMI